MRLGGCASAAGVGGCDASAEGKPCAAPTLMLGLGGLLGGRGGRLASCGLATWSDPTLAAGLMEEGGGGGGRRSKFGPAAGLMDAGLLRELRRGGEGGLGERGGNGGNDRRGVRGAG